GGARALGASCTSTATTTSRTSTRRAFRRREPRTFPSDARRFRLLEAAAAFDLFHHLLIFDVPSACSLFEVLDLVAHLAVDLFVDRHVLLENRPHLAA